MRIIIFNPWVKLATEGQATIYKPVLTSLSLQQEDTELVVSGNGDKLSLFQIAVLLHQFYFYW